MVFGGVEEVGLMVYLSCNMSEIFGPMKGGGSFRGHACMI